MGDITDGLVKALDLSSNNIVGIYKIVDKITSVAFDKKVDSEDIEVDGSKSSGV